MSLIKAMATVGGLTGLSRIAGFVRDVMTASFLGAGPLADAFFVALKLPNFFRNVTAEGAFSVAFVPIYTKKIHQEGDETAARFAGQAFSMMTTILSVFTLIIVCVMPWIMFAIAPGFEAGTDRFDLAVELSRITFPYLLLMSLSALVGGMLNAHEKFGPFASTSVFFNLTQIAAMLLGDRFFESPAHALAWSVTASGVIQLGRLLWYLKKYGIRLPVIPPRLTEEVRRLFALMGPGILGAGIVHINLFADIVIASLLPVGGISALYYAERLFQLPLGVVGIAVGTALLPLLTKALAAGNEGEARDLFNRALEYCLFFTIPAAVGLMVAHHELITVLFQRGAYSAEDAARTSPALACLAIGLPAYVGVKIFSSAYWSRQDTKTPVRIAASMALVNIAVALILTRFIDVAGISLATGLAGWIQCFFLWRGQRGNAAVMFDDRLKRTVPRIFLCAAVMGLVLFGICESMTDWFFGEEWQRLIALGLLISGGGLVYFTTAHMLGVLRLQDLKKYLTRRGRKKPEMIEEVNEID